MQYTETTGVNEGAQVRVVMQSQRLISLGSEAACYPFVADRPRQEGIGRRDGDATEI